nr:PREDICTED: uncharacterized protein LOC108952872 [Musa acuminata subsp. malaccensis]
MHSRSLDSLLSLTVEKLSSPTRSNVASPSSSPPTPPSPLPVSVGPGDRKYPFWPSPSPSPSPPVSPPGQSPPETALPLLRRRRSQPLEELSTFSLDGSSSTPRKWWQYFVSWLEWLLLRCCCCSSSSSSLLRTVPSPSPLKQC